MQNNHQAPQKKMVIGWFSFTCCEDSTIVFTELLNKNLIDWKKIIEFKHIKALKTKNEINNLDVAFIEGAISSDTQAKEVQKIRENAKYVVAIGACACTGKPSATRNEFTPKDITEKIKWYFEHFDYSKKVRKLDEVIKVDDYVNGCPMNVESFTATIKKYLLLCNTK